MAGSSDVPVVRWSCIHGPSLQKKAGTSASTIAEEALVQEPARHAHGSLAQSQSHTSTQLSSHSQHGDARHRERPGCVRLSRRQSAQPARCSNTAIARRSALTLGRERFERVCASAPNRVRLATLGIDSERSRAATLKRPTTRELEARWPALGVDERRTAMSELIDCVFVFPGEPGGLYLTRLFVCARGDAPLDLPHRGRRSKPIQPFSANDASRNDTL